MDNRAIAHRLLEMARAMEHRRASLYRVQAYRRAAETILSLDSAVEELIAHAGRKALKALPGIGVKLSAKIETLVRTGEIAILNEHEKREEPLESPRPAPELGKDFHANGATIPGDDPVQPHPLCVAVRAV